MTARTISKDMPDFPDTVRLTQEAPGMVGDTIAGTRVGVRHTRRRHAATLAALIAASAMVAGCTTSTAGPGVTTTATSGSSTATTTTTATATATPSATTAPTAAYPADVPAEARANTPDGAKAFAKHYFAQINKAYTTPQTGLLPPLSTPTCKSCANYEEEARKLVGDNQRYDRLPLTLLEVSIPPDKEDGVTLVDVVTRQEPARLIDSTGKELSKFSVKSFVFLLHAKWQSGSWVTNGIQLRQP